MQEPEGWFRWNDILSGLEQGQGGHKEGQRLLS